jgi:hypothetical protein
LLAHGIEQARHATGMDVPTPFMPDLGEHEFVGRPLLVECAVGFRLGLGASQAGMGQHIRHEVQTDPVGRIDVIVNRAIKERHLVAVPPASQAVLGQHHPQPRINVEALEEAPVRLQVLRELRPVGVGHQVINRVVRRHGVEPQVRERRLHRRPERRIKIRRARHAVGHNRSPAQHIVAQQVELSRGELDRPHAAEQQERHADRVPVEVRQRVTVGAVGYPEPLASLLEQLLQIARAQVPVGNLRRAAGAVRERCALAPNHLRRELGWRWLAFALAAPQRRRRQRQRRHAFTPRDTPFARFGRRPERHEPLPFVRPQQSTEDQHGKDGPAALGAKRGASRRGGFDAPARTRGASLHGSSAGTLSQTPGSGNPDRHCPGSSAHEPRNGIVD